jgi:hypothetical protein
MLLPQLFDHDRQIEPGRHGCFFGVEIVPCDHVAQMYADDTAFLDCLAWFIAAGLNEGED